MIFNGGAIRYINRQYSDRIVAFFEDPARTADLILFRRGAKSYDEAYFESLSKSAEEPENARGLDMIKLSWKRDARPLEPKSTLNPRLIELEMAKQILEEVFHARPSEVEEMIQNRLQEKNWSKESWREEEEPWTREFCLGE